MFAREWLIQYNYYKDHCFRSISWFKAYWIILVWYLSIELWRQGKEPQITQLNSMMFLILSFYLQHVSALLQIVDLHHNFHSEPLHSQVGNFSLYPEWESNSWSAKLSLNGHNTSFSMKWSSTSLLLKSIAQKEMSSTSLRRRRISWYLSSSDMPRHCKPYSIRVMELNLMRWLPHVAADVDPKLTMQACNHWSFATRWTSRRHGARTRVKGMTQMPNSSPNISQELFAGCLMSASLVPCSRLFNSCCFILNHLWLYSSSHVWIILYILSTWRLHFVCIISACYRDFPPSLPPPSSESMIWGQLHDLSSIHSFYTVLTFFKIGFLICFISLLTFSLEFWWCTIISIVTIFGMFRILMEVSFSNMNIKIKVGKRIEIRTRSCMLCWVS